MTASSNTAAPVGQGDYVVEPGDCMESIAFQHGFLWRTLWNLPENADLKAHREPNILLPGDRVTIPENRLRLEDRPTDQRHAFRLHTDVSRLQLRFLDDKQQPISGVKYILTIDGVTTNGSLDGAGKLNVPIPPNASKGTIRLLTEPDPETYTLDLGHLDPDTTPTGIRARLNNIGFPCASDGDWDDDLKAAIQRFQLVNNLNATGELDSQTRDALKQVHLS